MERHPLGSQAFCLLQNQNGWWLWQAEVILAIRKTYMCSQPLDNKASTMPEIRGITLCWSITLTVIFSLLIAVGRATI
jgi:hypothetical protein